MMPEGPGGGMADAKDSKSFDRKVMRVRLSPWAQSYKTGHHQNVQFYDRCSRESRTPEPKFPAGNLGEAVPRPNASDGEYSSRGRLSPWAQMLYLSNGTRKK